MAPPIKPATRDSGRLLNEISPACRCSNVSSLKEQVEPTENEGGDMNSKSILRGKNAVVVGAGGSIGAAVAKEFAVEGAEVFLAGRTKSTVEAVAKEIADAGGRAHVAALDSTDDTAVNQFIDNIATKAGKIDILIDVAG